MKTITIEGSFGTIPLENKLHSIFDINVAGQIATDNKYYCIYKRWNENSYYAVTVATSDYTHLLGRILDYDEHDTFCGEKVRGMTRKEEELYNMDALNACVDIWGNVKDD